MAYDSITPEKLGQAAMPADPTITTIKTVDLLSRQFVLNIDICNTTAASLDAFVYLVASGDSPTTANLLVPGLTIPGNGMFQWSGSQVLNGGDSIQVKGSAAGLTVNASGAEAV